MSVYCVSTIVKYIVKKFQCTFYESTTDRHNEDYISDLRHPRGLHHPLQFKGSNEYAEIRF